MKTLHLEQSTEAEQLPELERTVREMLDRGSRVAVTIAEEDEQLSPNEAAQRLGFSRQHVMRLIHAGKLEGEQLPNSDYWRIPLRSVLVFEEQREQARARADEFSRSLDELGAPLE